LWGFDDAFISAIWDQLSSRDDLSLFSESIDLSANTSQGFTNGLNLTGDGKPIVPKMVIQDRDLLEPSSSVAPGGLSLPKKQNGSLRVGKEEDEKHVFKAPQPIRASELGLDHLAMRKRVEKLEIGERDSKKHRLEGSSTSGEQPEFKGMFMCQFYVFFDASLVEHQCVPYRYPVPMFQLSSHSTSLSTVQSSSKAR
jgi:hypothetical protein